MRHYLCPPRTQQCASAGRAGAPPATAEDRVTQNSWLAGYLAALPNLYLRDCRVKVVVRGEIGGGPEERRSGGGGNSADGGRGGAQAQTYQDQDQDRGLTTFVFGIDFLSVTGGEDFLTHAREMADGTGEPPGVPGASSSGQLDDLQNEFLRKRIRTGKGPESGLWLQILSPASSRNGCPPYFAGVSNSSVPSSPPPPWAGVDTGQDEAIHDKWAIRTYARETGMCVFRCSGVDVHARILVNSRKELAVNGNFSGGEAGLDDDYYFDYDADLVMYGVDYAGALGSEPRGNDLSEDIDLDAIESIPLKSNFHRVARGMRRRCCRKSYHPMEDCSACWYPINDQHLSKTVECAIDSEMPLPGLVFYFTVTDPFEINVDRHSLESLHILTNLLATPSKKEIEDSNEAMQDTKCETSANDELVPDVVSREGIPSVSHGIAPGATSTLENIELSSDSFPTYMKPECVHVVGFHVACFVLRLHCMRGSGEREGGLAFCYWETRIDTVTLDSHNLKSDELSFRDTRVSLGQLQVYELKGVDRNRLVAVGLESDNGAQGDGSRPALNYVCAAAAILDVSSAHDALALLERKGNALHLSLVEVPGTSNSCLSSRSEVDMTCLDVCLGPIDADLPSGFSSNVMMSKREGLATLFNSSADTASAETKAEETHEPPSVRKPYIPLMCTEYTVRLESSRILMRPLVKCTFPPTTFSGQLTSNDGMRISTVLNRFKMEYGKEANHRNDDRLERVPLLLMMSNLPDGLRLRVLLYLDDLKPLERAMELKRSVNSFMRCHAVSNKIGQLAVKIPTSRKSSGRRLRRKAKSKKDSSNLGHQKVQLVNKLMQLDESTLEAILAAHGGANSSSKDGQPSFEP